MKPRSYSACWPCDGQALRLLQARYARTLLAVILRVVRDEALAQDLLQEGLLKGWFSIASYAAARGRLFTWVARACCNHAVDAPRSPRHRFHHCHPSLEAAGAHSAPIATAFIPDHIGVRELTLHLKPRQHEAIDPLCFSGYTQAEPAEELGIPLAIVKTQARTSLRVLAKAAR